MDKEIFVSAPILSKSIPLSHLFSERFSTVSSAEAFMLSQFNKSSELKSHYGSLGSLWTHMVAFDVFDTRLVMVTDDSNLIEFNLRNNPSVVHIPFLSYFLVCAISIFRTYTIICGLQKILLFKNGDT